MHTECRLSCQKQAPWMQDVLTWGAPTDPEHPTSFHPTPSCNLMTAVSQIIQQQYPLSGPLSRTTWISWYQKGKTNLDFTEARNSEWQWHQLGHMQICTSPQTDNHASTPPPIFLQARRPSCVQPKHWRHRSYINNQTKHKLLNFYMLFTVPKSGHFLYNVAPLSNHDMSIGYKVTEWFRV